MLLLASAAAVVGWTNGNCPSGTGIKCTRLW